MLGKSRTVTVPQSVTTPEPEAKIIITLTGLEAEKFVEVKARLEEEMGFRLHNHQAMSKIFQSIV
jgi:3'-phosphoadenosine 5'-phosphosulfate sulfotransferase (PAPS reductase)/FAD synthetase